MPSYIPYIFQGCQLPSQALLLAGNTPDKILAHPKRITFNNVNPYSAVSRRPFYNLQSLDQVAAVPKARTNQRGTVKHIPRLFKGIYKPAGNNISQSDPMSSQTKQRWQRGCQAGQTRWPIPGLARRTLLDSKLDLQELQNFV